VSQYWYESVDTGFKPGRLVALQRNARILVERTLEVKKGQQVCIVADTEVSPLLAWTVAGEVAAAGGIPSVVSWEANARPGMDVPAPVGAALLAADAIVACVSRSISFSKAIQEAYLVRGIPYVVMSNATEDMLMRGAATADVDVVAAIGHRTRDALNQGTKVRVTTPHGTDVTFDTTGRPWYSYSSFFEDGAKAAVFPGGEVNTCPDEHSGEGRIVIDSFMMEIGRIREPIVWELREGRIVSIEGGEEARLRGPHDRLGARGQAGVRPRPCRARHGCLGARRPLQAPLHLDAAPRRRDVVADGHGGRHGRRARRRDPRSPAAHEVAARPRGRPHPRREDPPRPLRRGQSRPGRDRARALRRRARRRRHRGTRRPGDAGARPHPRP
jgi:hypothetical protein